MMMKQMQARSGQSGFTLIELLIVVAIIGILAAIAVPQYQTYTKKAKFTEVINATSSLKSAVEGCIIAGNAAADCGKGEHGVPDFSSFTAYGNVADLQVDDDGVITATGGSGVDGATFILKPMNADGSAAAGAGGPVTWDKSTGSCYAAGLCN